MRVWHRRFKEGNKDTTTAEKPKPGRPRSSRTPENIAKVQALLDADRRRSVRELATETGLSNFVILKILKKDLNLSRCTPKFVPRILSQQEKDFRVCLCQDNLALWRADPDHFLSRIISGDETPLSTFLPEKKLTSQQWIQKGGPRPQKALKTARMSSTMMTLFFDERGVVHMEFVPKGETIRSEEYCETLSRLKEAIRRKRPELWGKRGQPHKFILHQDNAPVHVSNFTLGKIGEWGIDLLAHPPYSPDLAPCDFAIFPKLKNILRGRIFRNVAELQNAVKVELNRMHQQVFTQAIADFTIRWQKCVTIGGDYFEGRNIPVDTEVITVGESTDSSNSEDSD